MSDKSSLLTRRGVLATTAAAGALGLAASTSTSVLGSAQAEGAVRGIAIRPFRIDVPEEVLVDLGSKRDKMA
jgi:hypothetical protein